jgi:hypothetical protein
MDELENRLGAILGNPEMMQKIMTMAQSLGGEAPKDAPAPPPPEFPQLDPGLLQKLSAGLSGAGGIDQNQQTLLHALSPYISSRRISRLERAMKAAKMANFATSILGAGR